MNGLLLAVKRRTKSQHVLLLFIQGLRSTFGSLDNYILLVRLLNHLGISGQVFQ